MRRCVFLDRDGVLNRAIVVDGKPYPPANLSEFILLPEVKESLIALQAAGFMLIVITNQPDVARGKTNQQTVEEINHYLQTLLPIDDIKTCYHDTHHGCYCRKPLPGSILTAADQHQINLSQSFMVGDRWSDIEAGHSAGCKTIFIDYQYKEKRPFNFDFCVSSLAGATKIILKEQNENN